MGKYEVATGSEGDHSSGNVSIEVLDLSTRSYNFLRRNNINTVSKLLSMRKKKLLSIHTLSPQIYEELQERLITCRFMDPIHLMGPFAEERDDEDK